jgi:bifunctional ADP-heptose synthase (sugar kinase/adenylyltransferase)
MLNDSVIDRILAHLPRCTIGVLGDLFLDRYLDIDSHLNEPSLETGLTAYQVVRIRSYAGAAGTVINNLAALGTGRILPISFIGDDGEGYELRQALARWANVDGRHILITAERRTPTYTKPMLDGRELNRLDIKNRTPTPPLLEEKLCEKLQECWHEADAWLVLDQVSEADCGVVTGRVRELLAQLASQDPTKFVLADSRERIGLFRHVSLKPNERECRRACGAGQETPIEHCVEQLVRSGGRTVFCTQGEAGILLGEEQEGRVRLQRVAAYSVTGPIDPVGAGDSCSAGIVSAVLAGANQAAAAAFGSLIASITIQQIGVTGTATPQQVRQRWQIVK